ncbi:hypothetical protein FB567DRAFT_553402 [Paraphoma chrysanthemicola]|uniref:Uncharacterized protein n=1 Tax=Paraphoma chrysanthemicola TaxID=798071 RepID=A0A8K0QWC7_9PLEO|nr:hypothetical protein FB567DRAFT_553402 [Paraphoma chrysanthemicola]
MQAGECHNSTGHEPVVANCEIAKQRKENDKRERVFLITTRGWLSRTLDRLERSFESSFEKLIAGTLRPDKLRSDKCPETLTSLTWNFMAEEKKEMSAHDSPSENRYSARNSAVQITADQYGIKTAPEVPDADAYPPHRARGKVSTFPILLPQALRVGCMSTQQAVRESSLSLIAPRLPVARCLTLGSIDTVFFLPRQIPAGHAWLPQPAALQSRICVPSAHNACIASRHSQSRCLKRGNPIKALRYVPQTPQQGFGVGCATTGSNARANSATVRFPVAHHPPIQARFDYFLLACSKRCRGLAMRVKGQDVRGGELL